MTSRPKDLDAPIARRMWSRLELIHVVTYFTEPCLASNLSLGCQGFWMGYFASRAAPMGPVPASVVEATFFGFHSSRVRRAIPDAWDRVDHEAMVVARSAAAASALRSFSGDVDEVAIATAERLQLIIAAAETGGRPLFASNREVRPVDPVEALWQACTTLREHRGDGHVASLVAGGLDGCEANVLQAALGNVPDQLMRESRAWPVPEWEGARARLTARGLVGTDGLATVAGRALRADIEQRTDALAGRPMGVLDQESLQDLVGRLDVVAQSIVANDVVPFPNPIGLSAPSPA